MGSKERITMIVIVITLLMWMTSKLHGVDGTVVAILAVTVLLMTKVYDRADFRSGIAWDAAVFVGCIVGIGSVFPALGINKWMGTALAPYISPLFSNPYLFVVGFSLIIYALRFFILSQTATIAIFMVMLGPLAIQSGISPWVVGMVVYVAGNTWTVFYQNAPYVAAFYAVGGDMVNHGQIAKMSVAYMIISIIGLLVCVPFWQMMGLIK
jgi:DASS family divalent anion:Na+ symporter